MVLILFPSALLVKQQSLDAFVSSLVSSASELSEDPVTLSICKMPTTPFPLNKYLLCCSLGSNEHQIILLIGCYFYVVVLEVCPREASLNPDPIQLGAVQIYSMRRSLY